MRGLFTEDELNALVFKEPLILLQDGIARLGENLDQCRFIQLVEDAHDREAANKLRDQAKFDQILRFGLAEQFRIALSADADAGSPGGPFRQWL